MSIPGEANQTESKDGPASIAVTCQQVTHYHAARFRALARDVQCLQIIAATGDAEMQAVLSRSDTGLAVTTLFSTTQQYIQAVRSGALWRRCWDVLDRIAPRAVAISGWSFPESLAALGWAESKGARVILMSDSQREDAARSRAREWLKGRIVRACDAALVGGRRHRDYASALGMRPEQVVLGYDVVDNAYFRLEAERVRSAGDQVRRELALPERFLLASGRFVPKKNFPGLVRAFAKALSAVTTETCLVILGEGPGRAGIEEAIRSCGVEEHVILAGMQDYGALPAFYALADAFIHVPLWEQWGLVINEAAASGLPLIVSHRCGAAPELVQDGVNGYLVDGADEAAIAAAISHMLHTSDAGRRSMGERSVALVGEWGPERFSQGMRDALARCSPGPRPLSWADQILFRLLARHFSQAVG